MELDELRTIWQQKTTHFDPKNEAELSAMLKGRSGSIVSKLKRSVWFEIALTLIAVGALIAYVRPLENGALKWTSVSILVLFFVFLYYYVRKLNMLRRFGATSENLYDSISHLVTGLDAYLRFYERSYIILYPVFFLLALFFIGLEKGWEEFVVRFTQTRFLINLLLIITVYFAAAFWFTKWYLRKLYGDHLNNLRRLLKDIEDGGLGNIGIRV